MAQGLMEDSSDRGRSQTRGRNSWRKILENEEVRDKAHSKLVVRRGALLGRERKAGGRRENWIVCVMVATIPRKKKPFSG